MAARIVHVLLLTLGAAATVAAQAPAKPASFEVASVRESDPQARGSSMEVTPTRVTIRNRSLGSILLLAFAVDSLQIEMPAWANMRRVTIDAVIPPGIAVDRVPEMLQTLLRERFGLESHVESRKIPAYDLMVGSGIRMAEVAPRDELERKDFPTGGAIGSDTADNGVRTIASVRSIRTVTAKSAFEEMFAAAGHMRLEAERMTMGELAKVLQKYVERPVIDRTGLTSLFQFTLELPMPPQSTRMFQQLGQTANVRGEPYDFTGRSVPKTIQTLGLALDTRRDPVDVIVIDKLSQSPTPN